jgi:osmoprotectant transport system permease protein
MAEGTRAMDAAQLFPTLDQGQVTMIAARMSDGHLLSTKYAILGDDKRIFPVYQAQLLVRQDAFAGEPELQRALSELSRKIGTPTIRKLTAALDLDRHEPAKVAAEFLAEAGLK